MHANTHVHTHVFVDVRAGNPAQDGGCYLTLDAVRYQASFPGHQKSRILISEPGLSKIHVISQMLKQMLWQLF
jgi:hypothetical protein